jgi:hypothetical protein
VTDIIRTRQFLARRPRDAKDDDRGSALLLALILTMFVTAMGLGVVTLTNTERTVTQNFWAGHETLDAADAALERALVDLTALPSWASLPGGLVVSSFVGSSLTPTVPSHGVVDIALMTRDLQARSTASAHWGANNPVWHLFAHGAASALAPGALRSTAYLVVWIADDPAESDNDPAVDSNGVVSLVAEALGPAGTARAIAATVAGPAFVSHALTSTVSSLGPRILSWREIR